MERSRAGHSPRPEMTEAVIRPGTAAPADFEYEAVRVTDPALVNRLAGFFDAYWSGPPSHTGVGAYPAFMVEFVDRAGGRHTMLLTQDLRWFMSTRGDWPTHPAFGAFFQSLTE